MSKHPLLWPTPLVNGCPLCVARVRQASVESIHLDGGTMLGTSRGGADIKEIVKRLDLWWAEINGRARPCIKLALELQWQG